MKICFIFSNFHLAHLTAQSGIGLRLAQKAVKQGKEVFIISNGTENKKFQEEGIQVFLFKGLGDLKTYLVNLPRIIKYLKYIKPDVIHIHGSLLIIYIWFVNRFYRIPMVCSLCETLDIMSSFYKRLLIFCLNHVEKIFVSSEYIKNQFVQNGIPPDKIIVSRIGIDEKFLIKTKNFKSDADVLYFGDANKERGFDFILELAQKLSNLRFKVLLRWKDKNCRKELKKMKKLSNISLLFYPYVEDLKQLILKSKLVVLPFRWMGVRPPVSLLESMVLGRCVITSGMKGNEEILKNGFSGFLVDFEKIDNVASKILFLINNEAVRENIGQEAEKTIRRMYSPEEYNKIINYYNSLLKEQ